MQRQFEPKALHAVSSMQSLLHVVAEGATHCPLLSQVLLPEHVPHDPPQPLSPHSLPEQFDVQIVTHCPLLSQVLPPEHVPHDPLQPLSPHCLPEQFGVQTDTQSQLSLQVWLALHATQP